MIPCFNHGKFVAEAVASCLAQEDADVRVIVVDDGSDDGTTPAACDAVASERVRVVHQPNRGLPAARNRGVAEAEGEWRTEYLAFLDADDWIEPTFVSKLAAAIDHARREGPTDDVFHAYCQEKLVELGQGFWRVPEWDAELMLITNLHPVTALIRRDRFDELGGYDESMTLGYEDWELWVRAVGRGWRGVRVPEPLFIWRRHSHATMIHDAVARHADLVRHIIERNRATYEPRFEALYVRANRMLREFDCNWIDESGEPIPLRYLREAHAALGPAQARAAELEAHLAQAAQGAQALLARAEQAEASLAAASAQAAQARAQAQAEHAAYERMIAVRLHHKLYAIARRLPAPIRAMLRLPRDAARKVMHADESPPA